MKKQVLFQTASDNIYSCDPHTEASKCLLSQCGSNTDCGTSWALLTDPKSLPPEVAIALMTKSSVGRDRHTIFCVGDEWRGLEMHAQYSTMGHFVGILETEEVELHPEIDFVLDNSPWRTFLPGEPVSVIRYGDTLYVVFFTRTLYNFGWNDNEYGRMMYRVLGKSHFEFVMYMLKSGIRLLNGTPTPYAYSRVPFRRTAEARPPYAIGSMMSFRVWDEYECWHRADEVTYPLDVFEKRIEPHVEIVRTHQAKSYEADFDHEATMHYCIIKEQPPVPFGTVYREAMTLCTNSNDEDDEEYEDEE